MSSILSCYQLARRTPGINEKYDLVLNAKREYCVRLITFQVRPVITHLF